VRSPVIVREVRCQDAPEMSIAENDDMIEALAPDRTDEALGERILPRAVRRREDFVDAQALHAMPKLLTVDLVTVAEEIGRRGVVREGVHDLLGGPAGGGVLGHVEVNDAPAMVSEYDENEEDAQAHGRHREEIERDQVPDMVGEERPPGLRRLRTPLRDQARDRAFGHFEAKLQELAMNSWGAPERVRGGHACDQCLDLSVDRRSTFGGPARELGPVLAEAAPVPAEDSVGGHDHEGLFPTGPDPGQRDPKEAISGA